jgi:ribonuclease T2
MKQVGYALAAVVALGATATYFVVGSAPTAVLQMRSPDLPKGKGFDFYVLALSWSPTYCDDSRARTRDTQQCAAPRPFAFVVHGLWPQFERGFPGACQTQFPRPTATQIAAMLDIMPSERLVQHEWEQHGSCSGLSSRDYLSLTRAAYERVGIPIEFQRATQWQRISAGEVEAAFLESNPGLTSEGISVTRRGNLLSEVRICLTLDLKPRRCEEVDRDGAAAQTRLSMPPARGG